MAKAHLVLANGTKVEIEGTAEEVGHLLAKCTPGPEPKRRTATPNARRQSKRKPGPVGYIADLVSENFFKSKQRGLPEIQKKLEEKGHIYAQSSLSPAVLHHVRKTKILRRIKGKDGWVYVS